MLEQIDIPSILHLQGRLFESHGCLLLVCSNDISSSNFTIYEMMKGCSVWMVRYVVNTEEFMTLLPERWSIWSTIWSIGLGEREEDSFLVINLSRKDVKYNLISKTISQIFDIGLNQMDDDYEFFPPYTVTHNPYEFIPSFEKSRLDSRKFTIDNSFGSAEELDHVRILQSYSGLLLCAETKNRQLKHYKLNIEDHDHSIMTTIKIPHRLHRGRKFLEPYGGSSDDPILLLMKIPQMLHLEGKFFKSCGCLLLVCRDDIGSREFTIFKIMKGCSVCLHVKWAVLAAEKKKHVLLEKPVALNVGEFDVILDACDKNGVQLMDSTMWMHHPRTTKMKDFLNDAHKFGDLKSV
nr:uncharacterized oxidoreductase At4g09670 [Tanacetum cinerariifolium]